MASGLSFEGGFRVEDVEYLRHDNQPLIARLYLPVGSGPFPTVVEVHGGAWTRGDRSNNEAMIKILAARGILIASLDFRMPPAAAYPASLADINYGIRWLKNHASTFGANPDRIGGLGTSSGGHQILLSGMRPFDPRYACIPGVGARNTDARLSYLVGCWPIADPSERYRMAVEQGRHQLIESHHAFWGNLDAMEEGNPQRILDRNERVDLPPILVIQGTGDDNVDYRMTDKFASSYKKFGGHIELHQYPGEPHAFINHDVGASAAVDALNRISNFVHENTVPRRSP